jgi:hypothetical protein
MKTLDIKISPVSSTYSTPTAAGQVSASRRLCHGIGLLAVMFLAVQFTAAQSSGARHVARVATVEPVGISAGQISVSPNATVALPLAITDTTGKNIIAYQFNLIYDPTVLVLSNNPVTSVGTISEQMAVTVNANVPGIVRVAVYGAYALAGQGALLNLRFTAIGAVGTSSPLTWQNVLVNEGNPGNVATNGRVTISAPTGNEVVIGGFVRNATGVVVPYTHVMLTGGDHVRNAVRTNADGYYEFANVVPGQSYTVAVGRRLYGFTPVIVNVTNSLSNVDLVARPQ